MIRKIGMMMFCCLILAGFSASAFGGDTVAKKKKKKKSAATTQSISGNPKVKIETTKGTVIVELFSDVPSTTQNFVDLVSKGFYDGLTFHRYEPNFVIQGGDPTGTGGGGSGKNIPLEITAHLHNKGALGMARSQAKDSASCQFYICLEDAHFLDNNYAVFGQVLEGMENVSQLRVGDKMTKVTLLPSGVVK